MRASRTGPESPALARLEGVTGFRASFEAPIEERRDRGTDANRPASRSSHPMRDSIALRGGALRAASTLALAVAAIVGLPARADRIVLHGSQSPITNVTVDSENFNEVTYKRASIPDPQRIRSRDVSDIEREPSSEAYDEGREKQEQGDYANAVKAYQLAISKDGSKAWVKEYALFHLAQSQFALGFSDPREMQSALQSYEKHKADFPTSRFLPDVEIGIGVCLVELGRFRDAERHLTDLESSARSRYGIQYELLAKKWNAKTFEKEKRFGEAQTKYSSLFQAATKALSDADLKDFERRRISTLAAEARNLEGTCLILAEQYDRAKAFYEGLIREALPKNDFETLAGAYNGLGESLFHLGKPAEALQAFARTASVYFHSDPDTAKALYWMGLCEEKKQPGAAGLAAARAYYEQAAKVFPATEWAAKARTKLK
jgi:tetratricopeptide (TPR) repeat protein